MTEQYWEILEEITKKKNWYTKVFEDDIVNKWHHEVLSQHKNPNASDNFWLSIRILRATAQGTYHDPECSWDENVKLCDECFDRLKINMSDPDDDSVLEYIDDTGVERCVHLVCGCKSPDSELDNYVRYVKKGLVTKKNGDMLKKMVKSMREQDLVDWHPWSDDTVRDIIHPSLFCYVKGKSKHANGGVVKGKIDEYNRYQWLPSDIDINETGKVKFKSYINNLHRTDGVKLLETTLSKFIPEFEKVLHRSLRETSCQVIVKIASTHLNPDKPNFNGGSWHIEGMPYEHIVATGLHYLEVENITPSFLEFRKPVVINEMEVDYPQGDDEYTRLHFGVVNHHEGKMNQYLGLIKSDEGASVIFPNSLQHRIKEFALADKNNVGVRTIIAFFLIDPDHRILSTTDIPAQYGNMTLNDAKVYREKLMFQRKYFVDTLNEQVYEREFSLCEH